MHNEIMELVLQIKSENLNKVKDVLLKNETVNRASIVFKDGKPLGKLPGLRPYADYDLILEQLLGKGPDESSYV